jgi:hypothetical protein
MTPPTQRLCRCCVRFDQGRRDSQVCRCVPVSGQVVQSGRGRFCFQFFSCSLVFPYFVFPSTLGSRHQSSVIQSYLAALAVKRHTPLYVRRAVPVKPSNYGAARVPGIPTCGQSQSGQPVHYTSY